MTFFSLLVKNKTAQKQTGKTLQKIKTNFFILEPPRPLIQEILEKGAKEL
jgi:hypothetical protein